jgi:hypothetical protein
MLEKGFRPFSCTSRCAVPWVFCSLESMKNLLTEMCRAQLVKKCVGLAGSSLTGICRALWIQQLET